MQIRTILFILVLSVNINLFAQLRNEVFDQKDTLLSGDTQTVKLNIELFNYYRNTEYFDLIEKGQTFFGSMLQAHLYDAMNEDLNTPILIANLFEMVTLVNNIAAGNLKISQSGLEILQKNYNTFVFDILGLKEEQEVGSSKIDGLMQLLIKMRNEAKIQKNYPVSDQIRNELSKIGIELKDGKDGTSYNLLN
jgi:cysteinyl-tRNA synthetase